MAQTLRSADFQIAQPELCSTRAWCYHPRMEPQTVQIVVSLAGLMVALIGPLYWQIFRLDRGIAGLRERMARLEGLFEGFIGRREKEATQ